MPLRVAKLSHPSFASVTAYASQSAGIPDWVGPGGVTLVVDTTVLVVDVVVEVAEVAEVGAATQYESPTSRNWQFEPTIFLGQ
jgi:hypothetical protein